MKHTPQDMSVSDGECASLSVCVCVSDDGVFVLCGVIKLTTITNIIKTDHRKPDFPEALIRTHI